MVGRRSAYKCDECRRRKIKVNHSSAPMKWYISNNENYSAIQVSHPVLNADEQALYVLVTGCFGTSGMRKVDMCRNPEIRSAPEERSLKMSQLLQTG